MPSLLGTAIGGVGASGTITGNYLRTPGAYARFGTRELRFLKLVLSSGTNLADLTAQVRVSGTATYTTQTSVPQLNTITAYATGTGNSAQASASILTFASAHGLQVGDAVKFGATTGGFGSTSKVFYVASVISTTQLTVTRTPSPTGYMGLPAVLTAQTGLTTTVTKLGFVQPGSYFTYVVQALQQKGEIYFIGTPDATNLVFAMADDTINDSNTTDNYPYPSTAVYAEMAAAVKATLQAVDLQNGVAVNDMTFTISEIEATGASIA